MILSDMESLRRKLNFLLLMHTEGSGKLNISMQLVATSLDLVLNIFMNAPTTTYSITMTAYVDLYFTINMVVTIIKQQP